MSTRRIFSITFIGSLVLIGSFLISSCGPGQLFGPTFTPTPTLTLTPTTTPTPTLTPTPASQLGVPVSNERWEVVVEDIYTETQLTTDLITETRTYTAEAGSVFVVVRVSIHAFEQTVWEEIIGKDLLPMASILTENGITFTATGSSKEEGHGCAADCQFFLLNKGSSSEDYKFKTGFIFTVKKDDVFGKSLKFQFQDSPSILLRLIED